MYIAPPLKWAIFLLNVKFQSTAYMEPNTSDDQSSEDDQSLEDDQSWKEDKDDNRSAGGF